MAGLAMTFVEGPLPVPISSASTSTIAQGIVLSANGSGAWLIVLTIVLSFVIIYNILVWLRCDGGNSNQKVYSNGGVLASSSLEMVDDQLKVGSE